jgi:hypothetical protein
MTTQTLEQLNDLFAKKNLVIQLLRNGRLAVYRINHGPTETVTERIGRQSHAALEDAEAEARGLINWAWPRLP